MKRGATRDEIIRATQELITRNGIRAVRVDEIAQTLGISKRTLYEMFADKNDLVSACLDDMSLRQQQHIIECRKRRSGNSLQKALKLMNEYIEILCKVEYSFLTDIRRKVVFAEHYDEHREFWIRELTGGSGTLPRRGAAAPGDRRKRFCRTAARYDSGAPAQPHEPGRHPPLLQDHPARGRNP